MSRERAIVSPDQLAPRPGASTWSTRTLRLIAMASLLGGSLTGVTLGLAGPASAQTMPRANVAYYIGSNDPNKMYTLGCDQGNRDKALGGGSLILLNFGGQQTVSGGSGVHLINGPLVQDSVVQALSADFAEGYYICTGSDTTTVLTLAVGTNNSDQVSSSWGSTWASNVYATSNLVNSDGYGSQVSVEATDDLEPGFGSASAAQSWMAAYAAAPNRLLIQNGGSADGCPTSGSGNCNNGWSTSLIHYLSWGAAPAEPFPQIYNQTLAYQWANISASEGYMGFSGSLSQYYACEQIGNPCTGVDNPPDTSWSELAAATGQSPQFSDDIGYQTLS